jgi:hypothetical protein
VVNIGCWNIVNDNNDDYVHNDVVVYDNDDV